MTRVMGRAIVLLCMTAAACGSGSSASDGAAASDAAGDADAAEAGPPSCAAYCAEIQTVCKGSNQQYSNTEDCMNSCLSFPVGASGDLVEDSLRCRMTHLGYAAEDAQSATDHCVHAGPGTNAACGNDCEGYCDIVMMYCTAANDATVYDTLDQCYADCVMRVDLIRYTSGTGHTDKGNEMACLLYYAQQAASAPKEVCLADLAITATTCR